MKSKRMNRSTPLLVALAIVIGLCATSVPTAAEDALSLIRRVALARTAGDLDKQADANGTPIVHRDPTMKSTASVLHATGQLESASEVSLAELAAGRDLSFGYLAAPADGIVGDYYTGRLAIEDPDRELTTGTWSVVDGDGRTVAEGPGDFATEGELPPPGETFFVTCETSYGPGVDDQGDSCVNVVAVCEGWTGTFVYQGCLKPVE